MKVAFTSRARIDLAEIGAWIAADSPGAADRMVERLIVAAEGLAEKPFRFPETVRSLRQRTVGAYRIFYRVGSSVEIIRILHAARDETVLLDEI